jgi:hypothetical protein
LKRVKEYKRRECEYYFSLIFLQQIKTFKTNKKQRKNKQKTKKKQTKKVARAIG